jgi:DNA polymerase elongation subunit (family B)
VRGIELRRKDWCALSKRALQTALQMIFEGRSKSEILAFYEQLKRDLFAGKYDGELVITKEVKDEYKANVPHKRAWEKAVKLGLITEDVREVSYVWTKTGPEPYRPGVRIDYKYYWEKQLLAPLKRVLSCMETQARLLDFSAPEAQSATDRLGRRH